MTRGCEDARTRSYIGTLVTHAWGAHLCMKTNTSGARIRGLEPPIPVSAYAGMNADRGLATTLSKRLNYSLVQAV
jgi:hypothetical protein